MNYTRIYASIVLRAQSERTERLALKTTQGKYFEDHHIVPRSLGGKDVLPNMALLTAREHFVCHWLLTKIYPKGSLEYDKMMMALWKMQSNSGANMVRYVNSHVYEYLRIDFADSMRRMMSNKQCGECNSQYGTSWYTNCYNGECCKSKEILEYPWYKGRWLFRGESSKLVYWSTRRRRTASVYKNAPNKLKKNKRGEYYLPQSSLSVKQQSIKNAKDWWDMFNSGTYQNLNEFCATVGKSYTAIYHSFNTYLPIVKRLRTNKHYVFTPDKCFIGIYE